MGQINYNRGTTYTLNVNYSNTNGVSGSTAMFTVKGAQYDTDASDTGAVFKADAAMTGNAATITIPPTSIADTVNPGQLYYDVKVLDADSNIYLIDSGVFNLSASPTNRLI